MAEIPDVTANEEELLSVEQVMFLSITSFIALGLTIFYNSWKTKQLKKQNSLALSYKFSYPKEREVFEELIDKEPEKESPEYANWEKEITGILMKRAIVALGLHMKVTEDYKSYFMIYKSGINLDIWESVKQAKGLADMEVKTIQQEAESLKPGWGRSIFVQAQNLRKQIMMQQMQKMKESQGTAAAAATNQIKSN